MAIRSTFSGFEITNKGLFIAQKQLDVTGHNISNVDTAGYTRQRLLTASIDPYNANVRFLPADRGAVGGGAEAVSLNQIRDAYLDTQYRKENSTTTYWSDKYIGLYGIEDIFSGLDETALTTVINNFFNSFSELEKAPNDQEYRTLVRENALQMISMFNTYHTSLQDLAEQQNAQVETLTKRVNLILEEVAALNEQIYKYELNGRDNANDLRDKRNLLIDELSGYVDISYKYTADPTGYNERLILNIGNQEVINHTQYEQLEARAVDDNPFNDISDTEFFQLYIAGTNDTVTLKGGQIKCLFDLRDGNSANNKGIPYYLAQLDKLVESIVKEVNAVHSTGYTSPYTPVGGTAQASDTGKNFFSGAGLTAKDIRLTDRILESVFNIAASSEAVTINTNPDEDTGNNLIAQALAQLKDKKNCTAINSGFTSYYTSFLAELASDVTYADNMADMQDIRQNNVETQRQSVSGVSIDEEMTNLVRFQHAYSAAARAMTTMDEALDILINRTGRVGL